MSNNSKLDADENSVLTGPFNVFCDDLRDLMGDDEFSDVKFVVGPQKVLFKCHKCILAARCMKFKAMFRESSNTEETFVLTETSSTCFSVILQFIYTNSSNVNDRSVMDVMLLAMEYKLDQLVKICEVYILETVKIESACCALQAAVAFGIDSLKRALLPYFEENTKEIFNSSDLNELSSDALAYLLQSNALDLTEYEILMAVKRWSLVNSVALGTPIFAVARPVVANIRLPLLSSEELQKVELDNTSMRFIPVEQISNAWKHIALKTPSYTSLETTPRKGSYGNI